MQDLTSRELAIFVWTVVAAISLILILKDAIFNLDNKEKDDEL